MNICSLSVKRPVLVTMIVLIFLVIGMYSLTMLPKELMPEMELSMAIVYTQYPNVGSEEVENLVTKNIESAVSSVSGIKGVTSQSSEGSSMVMLEFSASTDMDKAVQDVKDSVDLISSYLPEDATDPMVIKMDMSMMPVAMMSVSYDGMDITQTKKFIEDNVQNKLEAIDGVASVNVSGAMDRVIEVEVDPEKLFGNSMTMTDAVNAIAAQNANLPAGSVMIGNKKYTSRVVGKFSSVDEISTVPLVTPKGQVIYLKDIAKVNDTYSEESTISRLNGNGALSVSITSESDANTVDVVNSIISTIEGLSRQYPELKYEMVMEQGSYIEESVSSVATNALTGGILAIIILFLFLANFKTSMVIGISMPVSIITTFIGMYFSGMTLNVVSLGGLSLGVGMLVDNSVVVLENIFRRRKVLGEEARTAAIKGAMEMIGSVVASVITTCIVYVPLLFVDNMMAIMFKQLAFTIIFSQTASLVVTFLIVPMLTSKISNDSPNKKFSFVLTPFAKVLDWFFVWCEKILRWCLGHRKVFVAGVMAVFVLSLVVLSSIGMILMNPTDQGSVSVSVELPQGSTLEDTNAVTLEIEKIISSNDSVENVFANVGSGSMAMLGQAAGNSSSVTVTLKEKRRKSSEDVAQELREALADVAGAQVTVSASSSMSMGSSGIEFEFSGSDDEVLTDYVLKAEEVLAGIDGVVETSTSIADTKSEVRILIDSDKAARYGLSTAVIANTIYGVMEGASAGRYTEGGLEYDIDIVYPKDYAEDINALKSMRIQTLTGQWIAVSDVADVTQQDGYTTLTRANQKRVLTLKGTLYDTDMATVNSRFQKEMMAYPMPEGVSRVTGGDFETMMDAMLSLVLAIFIGILLMYMVMAAQFENLLNPFVILFTLPLALIGVVLGHVIAGMPLSVVSCIGILMLTGIIVNNAIILIDFIKAARDENPEIDRTELMVRAVKTRLRPVLMTSLTSILGFLPMALALGSSGAAMMQPLAVSLIGGLTVGTFLTLFVIPVVYTLFDDLKNARRNKKSRKEKIEERKNQISQEM